MQHLLSQLNPQQREGVEAVDGPVLILAGAGSGKTRVITHRIAYLIEERGVAPDAILAVTFTNKAAGEMAERVEKLIGHGSLAKPQISTFHSFCVRLLRRDIEVLRVNNEGLTKSFVIYDETDQQAIVKTVMRRMNLDDKQLTPRVVLGKISWAKNHMIDPQEFYLASADPVAEKVAHIFEGYRKELRKANAMDFDDLLLEAVRVLKVSAETRERYNRRYRYLLIDEYQDTNRPQYELMKLMAGEDKNVCVVGDEDQSIYSWRGADIRNILEFEKDFPGAKTVRLEQNYRSTQNILEAASAVVARNAQRKGKRLWTARAGRSADRILRGSGWGERGAVHRGLDPEVSAQGGRRGWRWGQVRGAVPDELAVAAGGRGDAAVQHSVHDGGRVLVLRARGDQGLAELSEAGGESA